MKMEEALQHHGVKGMKWGVIRSRASKAAGGVKKAAKTVKNDFKDASKAVIKDIKTDYRDIKNSKERERGWAKEIGKINNMSTKDLQLMTRRINNEMAYKQLTKNRAISSDKDRKDYRKREKLSDQELQNRVNNLRSKDNLRKSISSVTKEQRDFGKKLVAVGIPLAMQVSAGKIDIGNLQRNMVNPDPLTASIRNNINSEIDKKYGAY